ncbi:MAG: hypothetical protein NTX12_05320 [Actinobacteria bacterium]|nr:hypothetical protein [Actinomycetota bacterium]
MAEMLIVWILVPSALLLLCFGLGLMATLATRKPLIATVVAAIGFLLITIVGSLIVISPRIAPYTAIIFAPLAGSTLVYVLVRQRMHLRIDKLSLLAGAITYFAYGIPILAYGSPRWAGWVKLDDNGTFLAVIDRLMNVGRTVPDPVLSTYQRVVQTIFETTPGSHFSYPVGSLVPLGVISKITGVESAWLFQPYLAFAAGLTSALFVILLKSQVKNSKVILAISVISVLASTLYSYAMWGAIKELVILIPLSVLGITLFASLRNRNSRVYFVYVFMAVLSLYFVGGSAVVGFAAPVFFIAFLVKIPTKNRVRLIGILILTAVAGVGVTYYLKAGNNPIGNFLIPAIGDQGNMIRALHLEQVIGIWPATDFRAEPIYPMATYLLIALTAIFVLLGAYFSAKRGAWVSPTLLATCFAVVANSQVWGGIWLTGKAMAIASPFFLLAAGIGLYEVWRKVKTIQRFDIKGFGLEYAVFAMAVLLSLGVLGSDVITYKNVWLAPKTQMSDLQYIGEKFTGQGPTLMTEYSVLGSRYFLRKADAEAVSELRVHAIPIRGGQLVPKGFAADIGMFDNATIDYFNLLVLRKSPNSSRPPLNYSLAYSGSNYEVWRKTATKLTIKATLPLGDNFNAAATPSCKSVEEFLSQRVAGDRIYTAVRSPEYVVDFAKGDLPPSWVPDTPYNGSVNRVGAGGFSRGLTINATGEYGMYVAGSYPGRVQVLVDGVRVFVGSSIFEANPYLTNPLGKIQLVAGFHTITINYDSPLFAPGADGGSRFGPIYLSTQVAGDAKVQAIEATEIPELCKQNLDWVAIAR